MDRRRQRQEKRAKWSSLRGLRRPNKQRRKAVLQLQIQNGKDARDLISKATSEVRKKVSSAQKQTIILTISMEQTPTNEEIAQRAESAGKAGLPLTAVLLLEQLNRSMALVPHQKYLLAD